MGRTTRRAVIASLLGTGVALAGCTNSGSPRDTDSSTPTSTPTSSEPITTEKSSSPADTMAVEEVAARFADRFTNGDYETATDLFESNYTDAFPKSAITPLAALDSSRRTLKRYWTAFTSEHSEYETVTDISRTDTGRAEIEFSFQEDDQRALLDASEGEITQLRFPSTYTPPAYVDPDAIEEEPITVQADGPELDGTLTLPAQGSSAVPAVVLVHGWGVFDRDYTIGPNKFFTDLAQGLASRGIAAIRYDKRATVNIPTSERDIDALISNDAVAAAEQIAAHDAVDEDTLFVAGHSIGGELAPRIAENHGSIEGIALLDAYSVPVGERSAMIAEAIRDASWYTKREKESLSSRYDTFAQLPDMEINDGTVVAGRAGAFWNSYLDYNPVETAVSVSSRVFVAQNGRTFAPAEKSFERWNGELSADAETTFYGDHNHYFQPGSDNDVYLPSAFSRLHDNFADEAVGALASWVADTKGQNSRDIPG